MKRLRYHSMVVFFFYFSKNQLHASALCPKKLVCSVYDIFDIHEPILMIIGRRATK